MAKSTLNSHIADAIQLQSNNATAYLAIGKTTPWADENVPPAENENATTLTEVIGYKKVKQFSLARPIAEGENVSSLGLPEVSYAGQRWLLVPVNKAYEQKARWIYIEADIVPDDFPLGKYRQVGIHVGLTPKAGVSKVNLLPSEVQSTGTLRFFENRAPQNRAANVFAVEQFIIKV